ncbi:MAG: 3-hydroxyacyl-CoA dehydrogenase family protein, partial [bacterium]|nr:3-hydroxyacyl-CoA dehydrogenase family protein [bacterium]
MKQRIEKVAVLGSGVMGSAIAAHFANAGIPSLVLDIVPREPNAAEQARGLGLDDRRVRDRIARDSVKTMSKSKPSPLFSSERLSLIEVGNLEDDLERLREVDWIVEAVREDLEIKSKLFAKVAPHVADHAVLTSNTSGLPLHAMAEALPETLRSRFFGTHFFNPPRYMKLLEVIPTKDTSEEQLARISRFSTDRLGKGVVPAKDTPNFISNRIGAHSLIRTLHLLGEGGFTIEEVDAVTGPAMGRPKTATFRLADLVGLDTLLFVSATVPKVAPHDEEKDRFVVPDFFTKMVQKGLHGRKSGAGFYKKVSKPEKKIVTLDLDTIEYRDPVKPDMPELRDVKKIDVVEDRVRA